MKIVLTSAVVIVLLAAGFFLMRFSSIPVQDAPTDNVEGTSSTDVQREGWVVVPPNAQGLQFEYPPELGTQYITAQAWPPLFEREPGVFVCEESAFLGDDDLSKEVEQRTINGAVFCVAQHTEGAAGSSYTTYEYVTSQGNQSTRVTFTLRRVQCGNYDGEERTACEEEQATFDLDALVHDMVRTITVR